MKHNLKINSNFRAETGRTGEDIAQDYLKKNGYEIMERNYKTKYGEIDLVAKQKDILVFVEVRTKIGERFGTPEETINKRKIKKLRGNALAYAAIKKWKGPCRMDAICIVLNRDRAVERLTHHENI